jgi:predicted nuclease of predicted toxin-antitoxin system
VIIWLDAQLSPRLVRWMEVTFGVKCYHVRDLALREAEDPAIFAKARDAGAVMMTKDEDFVRLVERSGSPPQVVWITSGNMSNAHFQSVLVETFGDAMLLIEKGEPIVEICRREN